MFARCCLLPVCCSRKQSKEDEASRAAFKMASKRHQSGSNNGEGKRPKGNGDQNDSQSPPHMDDDLTRSLQVSQG